MPTPKDDFKERLARYRQIKLSVIGRKSGRRFSIPVWLVLEDREDHKLYLLLVQGSRAGSLLPLPFPPTHKAAL